MADASPASSKTEAPEAPAPQAAGIGRNTVFAFLAQITTGFFTTLLTLYLVRALGSDGYGTLTLALGIAAIAGIVATGITQSAARFLAEQRENRGTVAPLLGDALRLHCLVGAVVIALVFVLASPIAAAYDDDDLVWPLRLGALAIFIQSVFLLYTTAFGALARVSTTLRLVFVESLAETVSSIALVALGAGVVGAVLGRVSGYLVGVGLALVVVLRLFGPPAAQLLPSGRGQMGAIGRYALPLLVISGAYTLYAQANAIIIGALLGAMQVGVFAAPLLLVVPLRYLGQSLAVGIAPRQVESGREPGSVQAFQTGLRWMIVYQSALLAPLIVWADPIVRLLFGSEYAESADVLRVLAPFIFLSGVSPLISNTVNYLGDAARRIPIVVVAVVVNVVLDLALLPWIGVVGAAVATSISYALYVPAHFQICVRELGFSTRPLGVTFIRAMIATFGMGFVLFAIGTGPLSAAEWFIGAALGTVVFAAILLFTREITTQDLRRGMRLLSAGLSAARR